VAAVQTWTAGDNSTRVFYFSFTAAATLGSISFTTGGDDAPHFLAPLSLDVLQYSQCSAQPPSVETTKSTADQSSDQLRRLLLGFDRWALMIDVCLFCFLLSVFFSLRSFLSFLCQSLHEFFAVYRRCLFGASDFFYLRV
jgi:hypothetical protein